MTQPTRQTPAGRAYLDLQNRARHEGRSTQELLTLYVVERWLARLSASPYAEQFVLKGGMLLAAYDARRPTADVDALARHIANDQDAVVARITEVPASPSTTVSNSSLTRRSHGRSARTRSTRVSALRWTATLRPPSCGSGSISTSATQLRLNRG